MVSFKGQIFSWQLPNRKHLHWRIAEKNRMTDYTAGLPGRGIAITSDPMAISRENNPDGRSFWARRSVMLGLVGLFVILAGAVFWMSEQQARKMNVGFPQLADQHFTLTDQTGVQRSNDDFIGRPLALFFGYTYCPDVCPMTLTMLSTAMDDVRESGVDPSDLQILFITVDAERDTPQQLAAYLSLFDMPVTGLTGSVEALSAARAAFGAYASVAMPQNREDGKAGEDEVVLFDHSAAVYLYDATGRFAGTIVFEEPTELVRQKLINLFAKT